MQHNIILCTQPSCETGESDQPLFSTLNTRHHYGESSSRLGINFLVRTALNEQFLCNCATVTEGVKGLSAPSCGIVAANSVTSHFIWSDLNLTWFDRRSPTPIILAPSVIYTAFRDQYGCFRRKCDDPDDRIRLEKVLDQVA